MQPFSARLLTSWYKFNKYYKLTDDTPISRCHSSSPCTAKGVCTLTVNGRGRHTILIEPAIDSVRNVWKELNCKTPTALVEPGIRERDDLRMLEVANIS